MHGAILCRPWRDFILSLSIIFVADFPMRSRRGIVAELPPSPSSLDPMRIATWNVNSIKQRVDSAVAWLKERAPDIVCLQETKCVDDAFPREPFEALGYNVAVHGQKTFNGVAILSKLPFDEVTPQLPGDTEDDHARFIEAQVSVDGGVVRVASIYLPNGNPVGTDKYT